MKLSRIPGAESTVKHSFNFKQSTSAQLTQYHELYMKTLGVEVSLKDVVEQMLLDFMAEDKTFQKSLKQKGAKSDAPQIPSAREPEVAQAAVTEAGAQMYAESASRADLSGFGG